MANKNSYLKKIVCLISCVLLLLGISIVIGVAASADDAAYTLELSENLESSYKIYTEIKLPKGTINGKAASRLLYAPDGIVSSADTYIPNSVGEYRVVYKATVDGKQVSREVAFTVETGVSFFNGPLSNAEYGADEQTGRTGIVADIFPGETYYYDNVVNMHETNSSSPAVQFTISPKTPGVMDATWIYITFTDVYDSNNKITYRVKYRGDNYFFVNHAKANDQLWKAIDGTANDTVRINYTDYGYIAWMSPTNSNGGYDKWFKTQYISLWYEENTNSLKIGYYHFRIQNEYQGTVIDFDDPSYQEVLWDGFTTGEVKISVSCGEYAADSARVVFMKFGDTDLTEKKNSTFVPEIDVGVPDMLLDGQKGCSYPVFSASASHMDMGELPIYTRVFYEYTRSDGLYTDTEARYAMEMNVKYGRFETPYVGKYAICYRVSDYFGNEVERVVTINVTDDSSPIESVVLENNRSTSGEINNKIYINSDFTTSGGLGDISAEYKVLFSGKIVKLNSDKSGYYFVPTETGNYIVTGIFTDLVGHQFEKTSVYIITAATKAVFLDAPELPKYFLSGAQYDLPKQMAIDTDGVTKVAALYITGGNGKNVPYSYGSAISLVPDVNGNVTLTYKLTGNEISYVVPVADVREGNTIKIQNYFASANAYVSAIADTSAVLISTTVDGGAEFVNPLLPQNVIVTFGVEGLGRTFSKLTFLLSEASDVFRVVSVDLYVKNGEVYMSSGGVGEIKVADTASGLKIMLEYDAATESVIANGGASVKLRTFDNGEIFDGFEGKVYFSFNFSGVTEKSVVSVSKIFNQMINSKITKDTVSPSASLAKDYGPLIRNTGDVVIISPILSSDVLSPYTNCTITFTDKDGNYLVSRAGVELNKVAFSGETVEVVLPSNGEYLLNYNVTDWNGRFVERPFRFFVLEAENPTIDLSAVSVETTIGMSKISGVTATAFDGGSVNISITVYDECGNVHKVKNDYFSTPIAGVYRAIIMAIDSQGCVAYETIYFEVK